MIYFNNGKYYLDRTHKLIETEPTLDKNGGVTFKSTGNKIPFDNSFKGKDISLNDVVKKLKNKHKEEKPLFEERKFNEVKKVTKFK